MSAGTESGAAVAARVASARQVKMRRQAKFNAWLGPAEVTTCRGLPPECRILLSTAVARLGLSAEACHRVMKLASTCADWGGEPRIRKIDVAEAVQLRALGKLTC